MQAVIQYSYQVDGERYAGTYIREFDARRDAREFARGVQGLAVEVHYNPKRPEASAVMDDQADRLASLKPAPPPAAQLDFFPAPSWAAPLIWPALLVSIAGASVSLYVLLASWSQKGLLEKFFVMHFVAMAACGLAFLASSEEIKERGMKKLWRHAAGDVLGPIGEWALYILEAIAAINFAISWLAAAVAGKPPNDVTTTGAFAAGWLGLFAVSTIVWLRFLRTERQMRLCPSGHRMRPDETYCTRCGRSAAAN
jgi:hypothetical protein